MIRNLLGKFEYNIYINGIIQFFLSVLGIKLIMIIVKMLSLLRLDWFKWLY